MNDGSISPMQSRTVAPGAQTSRRLRTQALLAHAAGPCSQAARDHAIDEAITLNIAVARTIAARYAGRGIPLEDLEQVACLALVKAARKFRPDQAEDFLSYAVPTIRGEVKKHFRDHGWVVRPPRRIQELQAEVIKVRTELVQRLCREPSYSEIAESIGQAPPDIAEVMTVDGCFSPTSLDQPLRGMDNARTTIGDLIAGENSGVEGAETRAMLASVLLTLRPRDRSIVKMRFFDDLTQREIGDQIGVTQMQVSRLLARILGELRHRLADAQEAS